jgi:tetratricopeptide (TPR) repeat protein
MFTWRAWFWPGFCLSLIALAMWRLSPHCSGLCDFDTISVYITTQFVIETFVVYSIVWMFFGSYRTRQRIVVLESVNGGGDELSNFAKVLSAELTSSLSELRKLHSTIDTARLPIGDAPTTWRSQQSSLFGDNSSQGADKPASSDITGKVASPIIRFVPGDQLSLVEIVGEKSSMKVLGVEIPLRPLLRLFQWFFVPPTRLSSSVHQQGGRLILFAGVDSRDHIWRVEQKLPCQATGDQIASAFNEAREELAYRVFTSLSSIESKEWSAVKEFSEGLRSYRRTLNSNIGKMLNLREAEDHFFRAFSCDKRFARCGYNLGIVYREIDDVYRKDGGYRDRRQYRQAATASFMQTLRDNPNDADAAYALAIICQETGDVSKSIEFAVRTIAQTPTHAQAWNVKGHLSRFTHADPDSPEAWKLSLEAREFAAAFAWRDLARSAWTGRRAQIEASKKDIIAPLINLAAAYDKLEMNRRLTKAIRQALRVNREQNLHSTLGEHLLNRNNFYDAIVEFKYAISLAPTLAERARYYAYLAEAQLRHTRFAADPSRHLHRKPDKILGPDLDSFKEALASPSSVDGETLSLLESGPSDNSETIKLISSVQNLIKVGALRNREHVQSIGRERQKLRSRQDRFAGWARAVLDIEYADLLLSSDPPDNLGPLRTADPLSDAIILLRKAIDSLRREFPTEERLPFAYERLAQALRRQGKVDEALIFADMAVAQSPFSASASRELGLVHYCSSDYDRSEQELRKSFALDPFNRKTLEEIGKLSQSRADISATRSDRTAEFQKAIGTFHQALNLGDEKTERNFLHHWLGRYYGDIGEYERARKHYAITRASKEYELESTYYSGWTAFEQENYPLAESLFRETFRLFFRQWERSISFRDFLRKTGDHSLTGLDETRGDMALRLGIFMAVIVAERYHNFERARRLLKIVKTNIKKVLWNSNVSAEEKQKLLIRFREKRKEIEALHNSYLGWICCRAGAHVEARKYLNASLKIRELPETVCHLAWLELEYGRDDRVREHCLQARRIDIRGWCEAKIARIEAKLEA